MKGSKLSRPTSEKVRQRLALRREHRQLTEQISLLPLGSKLRIYLETRRAEVGHAMIRLTRERTRL